jgi:hypothetical protein
METGKSLVAVGIVVEKKSRFLILRSEPYIYFEGLCKTTTKPHKAKQKSP